MLLLNERKSVPVQAAAHIQRWALTFASYEYKIKYKESTAHANADASSCLSLEDTIKDPLLPAETVLLMEQMDEMPVTSCQVKTWTHRDPILSHVLQYVQQGWPAHLVGQDE